MQVTDLWKSVRILRLYVIMSSMHKQLALTLGLKVRLGWSGHWKRKQSVAWWLVSVTVVAFSCPM